MRGAGLILLALALAPCGARAQGDAEDGMVDARIRASAQAAESLQGPLDGGWTLVTAAGQPIFAFQLVDKPNGDPLEGVWRDLRRPAVPGDIGLIDGIQRTPGELILTFAERSGAAPTTISLRAGAGGAWSGELREDGAVTAVALRRGA
jgi:hypothetical protein